MRVSNWDTETADKCQLPKLIPDICDDCRDYRYCHRQLTFDDLQKGGQHEASNGQQSEVHRV